jgi:hypothetical protein
MAQINPHLVGGHALGTTLEAHTWVRLVHDRAHADRRHQLLGAAIRRLLLLLPLVNPLVNRGLLLLLLVVVVFRLLPLRLSLPLGLPVHLPLLRRGRRRRGRRRRLRDPADHVQAAGAPAVQHQRHHRCTLGLLLAARRLEQPPDQREPLLLQLRRLRVELRE